MNSLRLADGASAACMPVYRTSLMAVLPAIWLKNQWSGDRPPIFRPDFGLVTYRERNALLAHLAAAAHGVAKLIDEHVVAARGQGFFVAFQRAIALNAVAAGAACAGQR